MKESQKKFEDIQENLLQKPIIIMKQNSAHFEEGIICALQSAWQTFEEWQSRAPPFIKESFMALLSHFASLAPDNEWISFTMRSISWIQTRPSGPRGHFVSLQNRPQRHTRPYRPSREEKTVGLLQLQ